MRPAAKALFTQLRGRSEAAQSSGRGLNSSLRRPPHVPSPVLQASSLTLSPHSTSAIQIDSRMLLSYRRPALMGSNAVKQTVTCEVGSDPEPGEEERGQALLSQNDIPTAEASHISHGSSTQA